MSIKILFNSFFHAPEKVEKHMEFIVCLFKNADSIFPCLRAKLKAGC